MGKKNPSQCEDVFASVGASIETFCQSTVYGGSDHLVVVCHLYCPGSFSHQLFAAVFYPSEFLCEPTGLGSRSCIAVFKGGQGVGERDDLIAEILDGFGKTVAVFRSVGVESGVPVFVSDAVPV